MSNCNGCGELIGTGNQILAVYPEEDVDLGTPDWDENRAVFCCRECKEIFEDHHDTQEVAEE